MVEHLYKRAYKEEEKNRQGYARLKTKEEKGTKGKLIRG
jgi:hypothetical protein